MELGELVRMSALDLSSHEAGVELGVLVFAGVVVVGLLLAKARRAHVQKLRKAASTGYYDFDVARYGGTAPGRSLIESTETEGPQSLASSFSAPRRGSRRKDRSSASVPPVPAPPPQPQHAEYVFSSAPPASAPLPPPPAGPSTVGTEGTEAAGSGLPLLVPPPPPPPGASPGR
jgi:hypothetical protein